MRIEIWTVYESLSDNWLHLRISMPDGNCYNFRVPKDTNKRDEYSFDYPYESMRSLHEMLDKFINKGMKDNDYMLELKNTLKFRLNYLARKVNDGVIPGRQEQYEIERFIGGVLELKNIISIVEYQYE